MTTNKISSIIPVREWLLPVAGNLTLQMLFLGICRVAFMSVFTEFRNDNVTDILGIEFLSHWYFILLFLVMLVAMWRLYRQPRFCTEDSVTTRQLIQSVVMTLFVAVMTIGGIRGGFDPEQRPINNKDAKEYAPHPIHSALVLNTPYSIIRTMGKSAFPHLEYYGEAEAESIYSPVHPAVPVNPSHPNVAIIILESFGSEYSAYLNGRPEEKGYMPFLDSLMREGLTFESTFSNGHSSIDGQASVHLSVPLMVISFFTSHAALNEVRGVATELRDMGYHTAYFHGADNGSLGLDGFAKSVGYDNYYGRTEYNEDSRFGGDKDFDGMWAIWDEPFLQFYATKMTELKEPFITTVFTASSHHPYHVPEQYAAVYPEEGTNPIHKCIRYTDMSLRKFFETASRQPWYSNTIFVFTSDHTNIPDHKEFSTDMGLYSAPIFFYDPSGEMPRERRAGIAQQIDIMPTLLGYLGYNKPYVAFGIDLLNTPSEDTWAVTNNNGIYQFVKGDYVIHFDGTHTKAAYNYKKDWLLEHNLISDPALRPTFQSMERTLKAIIQSYMQRMTENNLIVRE